jgi:hypothetical protein
MQCNKWLAKGEWGGMAKDDGSLLANDSIPIGEVKGGWHKVGWRGMVFFR